jgi:hypothetical protein
MVKDQNTYAKRARETAKKRKAEAKRERRQRKKEQTDQIDPAIDADAVDTDPQTTGDQSQHASELSG